MFFLFRPYLSVKKLFSSINSIFLIFQLLDTDFIFLISSFDVIKKICVGLYLKVIPSSIDKALNIYNLTIKNFNLINHKFVLIFKFKYIL